MVIENPVGSFNAVSGLWQSTQDWAVELFDGSYFVVEAGATSDGASIPRFLWSAVGPRFAPDTFGPALFHDLAYASHLLPRKDADAEFRRLLQYWGVSYSRALAYYLAVRSFGWMRYNRVSRGEIEHSRQYCRIVKSVRINFDGSSIEHCR